MDERGQFTFYRSFWEAIKGLPKKDRLPILEAIISYALDGTEPEGLSQSQTAFFLLCKPTLDSSRKKAESGKQGGSKPKANGKQTVSKPKANGKQTESEKEGEKEIEIEKEIEVEVEVESKSEAIAAATADKKLKLFRGELGQSVVFLSEAQIEDLLEKLDLDGFDYYVDKLATFIIRNDAKVKNHYETILKWWEEDSTVCKRRKTDVPKGATGKLGQAELEAIQKALAEE